jgi:hypothetical protein
VVGVTTAVPSVAVTKQMHERASKNQQERKQLYKMFVMAHDHVDHCACKTEP